MKGHQLQDPDVQILAEVFPFVTQTIVDDLVAELVGYNGAVLNAAIFFRILPPNVRSQEAARI